MRFANRFSPDVQDLIRAIEERSGREIGIHTEAPKSGDLDDPSQAPLACNADELGAYIIIPNDEYFDSPHFDDGSLIHELLHIHRWLVVGIPQIVPDSFNPPLEKMLSVLDNEIEHLHVVKQELQYRPHRAQHWITLLQNRLSNLTNGQIAQSEHEWALIAWIFTNLVLPQDSLLTAAGKVIDSFSLRDKANEFLVAVSSALHSKEQLTNIYFEFMTLDKNRALLFYITDITREHYVRKALGSNDE